MSWVGSLMQHRMEIHKQRDQKLSSSYSVVFYFLLQEDNGIIWDCGVVDSCLVISHANIRQNQLTEGWYHFDTMVGVGLFEPKGLEEVSHSLPPMIAVKILFCCDAFLSKHWDHVTFWPVDQRPSRQTGLHSACGRSGEVQNRKCILQLAGAEDQQTDFKVTHGFEKKLREENGIEISLPCGFTLL